MNFETSGRVEKAGRAGTGETSGAGETSETGGRNGKAGRAGTGETSGTGGTSGTGETSGSASRTGRDVGRVRRVGVFFCFCGLSFVICNYFVSLSLEIYNSKLIIIKKCCILR